MPPDPRHAEAAKWLASACGDLRGAEAILASGDAPAPSRSDASEAIELARRVYEAVSTDLAREGVDLTGRPCE